MFAEAHTAAMPEVRVTKAVDNAKRTTLYGHTPRSLKHAINAGRVDPSTPAEHLIILLKSSQAQEREARRVIDEQQDKKTANFHQWMTPGEFGVHFGVHDSDIENVKAWLSSQGFTVEEVAKSKRSIRFTGSVGQLEHAFQTEMHYFVMPNGETHVSNDRDITVPEALSPVIAGVPTLNDFFRKSHRVEVGRYSRIKPGPGPRYSNSTNCAQTGVGPNDGNTCYVGPADFATIYNTAPLLASGFNGTGVTIGIVGRSDILMSDVQTYRQMFNLPVNDPIFIHAGQDNGIEAGDDGESDLDVEISGGIAPSATVKFVIGTPTFLVDGITNSIQYIVENNVADIMSTSYGDCESNEGAGGNSFNSQMFEQAAAQGISVFVADGDNGAAECDDQAADTYEVLGYAASAEGSTPYNVSVGGTEFDEGSNTGYWSNSNNPLNQSSALSYIPEVPWNEAKNSSYAPIDDLLEDLWSGSGGISAYYLQPAWQRGSGVPTSDPVLTQGGDWIIVNITNPGSGYTTAPSVTFSGETCASNPVTASTTISGGQVTSVVYNDGTQGGTLHTGQGFNCTVPGTVTFTAAPGGGTTATGTPVLAQMQNILPLIPGVPHRYTPDLSLNAASGHDGTIFCSEGVCEISPTGVMEQWGVVGGTSVAAPSMAGVQALINQYNGGRQGMPAYIYYTLANNAYQNNPATCNSSTPPAPGSNCPFQDITAGNNLICGTSACTSTTPKMGFNAGTGYDMATGLGSPNAANLASQWSTVTFFSSNSTLNLSQTSFQHGTPIMLSGVVGSGSGTPTGDVAFIVSQGAIGETVNQNTGALNGPVAFTTLSGGAYSATLNNLPGGTYYVTARYGGDEVFASSYSASVPVTVSQESSGLTLTPYALNGTACTITTASSFPYASDILINVNVSGVSGAGAATGTVTISDNATPIATNQTLDANGDAFLLAGAIPSSSCIYQYDFANTPTLTVGTHNLTATYSGDASLGTTSVGPVTISVTQATPTLTLAASATQITSGFSDQLTATLGLTALTGNSIGSLAPTGTVTFKDTTTGATLGTANVVSTSVTTINAQTTTFTAVAGPLATTGITQSGANSITATYSGDTNWASVTSAAVTVTVGTFTTATTTTVTNAGTGTAGNPTILGGRPTFTATVSGGAGPTSGTVTFYDTTTTNNYQNEPAGTYVLGTGTVGSSHTATFRIAAATEFGGGTHTISASFGGVATTFGPSATTTSYVETVTQGTTTNVLTAKTVGKSGQNYYFTSVITPSSTSATYQPTANVQFFDACSNCSPSYGTTSLGTAPLYSVSGANGGYGLYEANLSSNTLPVGTHTITSTYPGDVNYTPSSDPQTVFVGGTPTLNWATPLSITYPAPLTATQLNATANIPGTFVYSPPAGTVLNAGSQPLSVTFTPSDYTDFGPQVTGVTLQVNQASQTITFTTNAPASAVYGSNFTVAATGGASGNPVVFSSAGSCSNVGANYTMTSGTGTCSVIANQAGTTNYSAAPQVTQNVNAALAPQTITFTTNAPASAVYNSSFGVAATASSGDTVAFTSSGVCSNTGATYMMTSGTGTCSVIANQPGDSNYSAAPQVTQNVNATLAPQTIAFTTNAPANAAYNSSFGVAATASSGDTVAFTSAGSCSNSLATYTMTSGTGACSVIANQAGDTNYSAAPQVTQSTNAMPASSGTLLSSLDSSIYSSQSTTLTATVSVAGGGAPSGTVSFMLGATVLGTNGLVPTGPASSATSVPLTASQLALGANSIYAVYSGSMNFLTSTSPNITVTLLSSQASFGSVAVGTPATVQTLTYQFSSATTLTAIDILTGGASGLDYTDGGSSTCAAGAYTAGQSCTVTVAFTPSAPGARAGAVTLFAQGSNLPLMTWYLSGIGQSGAVTIDPGTLTTTTLTGTVTPAGYGSAVDGAGNVYVVDHANGAVLELAAGTFSQSTVVSGLSSPTGVALDGAGNLYISNGSSVVMVPNESGTLNPADQSTVSISGLGSARGIAVDAGGDLYVADATNGDVVELSNTGVQTTIASGLTAPHGVAVDTGGNVYVATNNAVTEYPFGGGTPVPYGTGYNNPRGLAVDASGAVYVADTGNSRIVEVAPGGATQTALTITGLSAPQGVSLDSSDNLYVTDPSVVIQVNRKQAAQLNFPSTPVDSTSATQVVTLSDAGNEPLQVSNLAISTNFAQEPSGGTDCTSSTNLSSAGQCEIGVAFAPTVSGALTGTVTLTDNALNNSGSTQTVQLSGGAAQVAQTISFTTGAPASAAYNSSFVVAATASSGLTVAFTSAGACSNVGATYTMTIGTGTCTVIANQSGNSEYSAAPTVMQYTTATLAGQTITFTTNAPANAAYNSSFVVAATASSGLTVAFTSAGACSNVGATYTMTSGTGTCSVIANQAGTANYYSAAPQVTQSTTATKIGQSITFTVNAPSAAPYQSSFMVAATASSGDPVAFTSSGVCTNVGATYTMTAASGTCTVIANQAGDNNYTPAPQATETTTAEKASPTVTFTGAPATALYQSTFTVTATTNASTQAVIKTSGPCSNIGTTVTMTKGAGTCTVTAKWAADSHYLAASLSQTTTAEKLVSSLTWATPAAITYGTALSGTQLDATASYNSTPLTGTFVYTPPSGTKLSAGSHTLSVKFTPTQSADYTTATGSVTLVVNKINTTTQITSISPASPIVGRPVGVYFEVSAAYGTPTKTVTVTSSTGQTCTGTLAGGIGSCTLHFSATGSQSLTATYNGDSNDLPSTSAPYPVTVAP